MNIGKNQLEVFKSIVYLQNTTIGKIAQATGMHRQSVKIILNSLIEMDFVGFRNEGNKKIYYANKIEEIKKKYVNELDEQKKDVPRLKSLYEESKNTQILNALSGKSGIKSVLLDEIIKGKEICSFHYSVPIPDFEEEYRANDDRRIAMKIPLKILSAYPIDKKIIPLSNVRKTSKKSKIETFVYADKIAINYFGFETKIFTIKINEVTKLYRDMFESEWKKAKKQTKKG